MRLLKLLLLTMVTMTASAYATGRDGDVRMDLSSFVGGGSGMESSTKIRHVTGYEFGVERTSAMSDRWHVAPRLSAAQSFVDFKDNGEGSVAIGTYDHRTLAMGSRVSWRTSLEDSKAPDIYVTPMLGTVWSKLSTDASTNNENGSSFLQNQYSGLRGSYVGVETGAFFPLKDSFGINVGLLASLSKIDQTAAHGTFEGDYSQKGSKLPLAGTTEPSSSGLSATVYQKSASIKVGLNLGF